MGTLLGELCHFNVYLPSTPYYLLLEKLFFLKKHPDFTDEYNRLSLAVTYPLPRDSYNEESQHYVFIEK